MVVFDACYTGKVWKPAALELKRQFGGLIDETISQPVWVEPGFGRGYGAMGLSVRRVPLPDEALIWAKLRMKDQTALVLTSGDRPVADAFPTADGKLSRNSPYADKLLKRLRRGGDEEKFGVLTGTELHSATTAGLEDAEPFIGTIGDRANGDFVFVPRKAKTN